MDKTKKSKRSVAWNVAKYALFGILALQGLLMTSSFLCGLEVIPVVCYIPLEVSFRGTVLMVSATGFFVECVKLYLAYGNDVIIPLMHEASWIVGIIIGFVFSLYGGLLYSLMLVSVIVLAATLYPILFAAHAGRYVASVLFGTA